MALKIGGKTSQQGSTTTTVAVKTKGMKDAKTVKNARVEQGSPVADVEGGLAKTRSGLGITLSYDYQSVRIDAWTELPCRNNPSDIEEAHKAGFQMSSKAMAGEIEEAKEFLAGGQDEIFKGYV